jgi:hypothetical protein
MVRAEHRRCPVPERDVSLSASVPHMTLPCNGERLTPTPCVRPVEPWPAAAMQHVQYVRLRDSPAESGVRLALYQGIHAPSPDAYWQLHLLPVGLGPGVAPKVCHHPLRAPRVLGCVRGLSDRDHDGYSAGLLGGGLPGQARPDRGKAAMFHPQGPTVWALLVQALSSTVRGYDLLAPNSSTPPFGPQTPFWFRRWHIWAGHGASPRPSMCAVARELPCATSGRCVATGRRGLTEKQWRACVAQLVSLVTPSQILVLACYIDIV